MLSKFIKNLQKLFTAPTSQSELDAFIKSKNPTSVGDVEYWIDVYDRKQYIDRSRSFNHHSR